jgi:hypothetical protein
VTDDLSFHVLRDLVPSLQDIGKTGTKPLKQSYCILCHQHLMHLHSTPRIDRGRGLVSIHALLGHQDTLGMLAQPAAVRYQTISTLA